MFKKLFILNNLVYAKGGVNMKNKIAFIRKSKNIQQKELAKKAGCSLYWLNKIENGKRNPGLELSIRIAEKLDVTLNDIFLE